MLHCLIQRALMRRKASLSVYRVNSMSTPNMTQCTLEYVLSQREFATDFDSYGALKIHSGVRLTSKIHLSQHRASSYLPLSDLFTAYLTNLCVRKHD